MRTSVFPILVSWLIRSLPSQYSPVTQKNRASQTQETGKRRGNMQNFKMVVSKTLTGSLTVTLSSVERNVAKTTSIVVPASAEVHTSIKSVLDEKPTWNKMVVFERLMPKGSSYLHEKQNKQSRNAATFSPPFSVVWSQKTLYGTAEESGWTMYICESRPPRR